MIRGSVVPVVTRSARQRPIKQENLNPWPLHGLATITSGRPGQGPTTKSSPGATVYRQTSAAPSGAAARDGM